MKTEDIAAAETFCLKRIGADRFMGQYRGHEVLIVRNARADWQVTIDDQSSRFDSLRAARFEARQVIDFAEDHKKPRFVARQHRTHWHVDGLDEGVGGGEFPYETSVEARATVYAWVLNVLADGRSIWASPTQDDPIDYLVDGVAIQRPLLYDGPTQVIP